MFKSKILTLLIRRDYKPLKLSRLAKVLNVSSADYPAFKSAFTQLRKSGKVTLAPGNLITLPQIAGQLTGTFKANPNGFGFVIPLQPNSHGDLYIAPEETAGAMTGDTVAVHLQVIEGDKERIQVFQGVVIQRRGSGINAMFTVRKVSNGIGVERVFPLHSPRIAKIERLRAGKVRRAKLFYLRNLRGKAARIDEKR